MSLNLGILLVFSSLAFFSICFSFFCLILLRKYRQLLEFSLQRCEDLDDEFRIAQKMVETDNQRLAEQSRKVAWLEMRVRQPKTMTDENPPEMLTSQPEKMNFTERRYRVLKLASRGQNPESIATQLGMMPGEVELILNLRRVS